MEEGLVEELLRGLAHISVNVAKVTSAPASETFTSLAHTIVYADHYVETFEALALFSVDKQLLMRETASAQVEEALQKLQKFFADTNFVCLFSDLQAASNEAFLILAAKVLTPLSGEYVLSMEYRHMCQRSSLTTGHLGMGTSDTWHGFPDARCYTVDMLSSSNFDFWEERESTSSPVDGKYNVLGMPGLNQVTGHAVVTSFVHSNRPNTISSPPFSLTQWT